MSQKPTMQDLPTTMLAKSVYPGRAPLTLAQHCADAEDAARHLFALNERWGETFCRFFRVEDRARFLLNLRVAALFHDLGKANEDFQRAVTIPGSPRQTLRHEHLSALVLCLPQVRDWLAHNPALDIDAITAAVLSHHLKAASEGEHAWCQPHGKAALALFLAHADVADIFKRVRALAELPPPPLPLPVDRWSENPPWRDALRQGKRDARKLRQILNHTSEQGDDGRRGLLLAVKAGLIAADSAASALVRTGRDISAWIRDVAHAEDLSADALDENIIRKRCDSLAAKSGKPFTFHTFQERTAELGPRALLIAGCGSGKTLAAWRWASRQLAEQRLGHVLFLYPTRGTATEGFRDYVGWAPESEGALLHGNAAYELDAMAQTPAESMGGKNFAPDEAAQRLYALGMWSRRYFSATVDQFLSFLAHRYESLCLLPLLADSAIILDEVHSYDRVMFQGLKSFLRHFDVPVLCMTATLPPDRKRQLEELGLRAYPTAEDRRELADLERAEGHPRYRLRAVAGEEAAFTRALDAARAGERVLCVVNTVARCQRLARRFQQAVGNAGPPVLAYHSRYRLRDRQDRHAAAVAAFRPRSSQDHADSGVICVATQVCEMSLDLDADVLVTELAPVPSLVQRFGRANRHLARGDDFRAEIYLYPPEGDAPYHRDELDATRRFLDAVGVRDSAAPELSQRALAEAVEQYTPGEADASDRPPFITSGYYAVPGDFRDIDQISATCVLDRDLAVIDAEWRAHGAPMRGSRRHLDDILPGFEVGVPRKFAREDQRPEWLPRYIQIAPAASYSESLGFLVTGDLT